MASPAFARQTISSLFGLQSRPASEGTVADLVVRPAPKGAADVKIVDGSGAALAASVTSNQTGSFTIRTPDPLPANFQVTVNAEATANHPAFSLAARVEGFHGDAVVVNPVTTVINSYVESHSGIGLREATGRVFQSLRVVNPIGARRGASGRVITNYSEAAFFTEAAKHGGPAAYLAKAAGAAADRALVFPGISDDAPDDIAAGLFDSMLSSLSSTLESDGSSMVTGWIMTVLGIGGQDSATEEMQEISNQLAAISTQLNTLEGVLAGLIQNLAAESTLVADWNNLNGPCSDIQSAASLMKTPVTNGVLTTLLKDIAGYSGYPGKIAGQQTNGYLATWIGTNATQYYCDAVQQPVIHQQFDYYQQMQFMIMTLLMEYYHCPQPGTVSGGTITPPTPPQYAAAHAAWQSYYDALQQQVSLLPFPSANVYSSGANLIVYDRVNNIPWINRNLCNPNCRPMNMMTPVFLNQNLAREAYIYAVPTLSQLKALAAACDTDTATPGNFQGAYSYIQSALGNPQLSPPLTVLPSGVTSLNALSDPPGGTDPSWTAPTDVDVLHAMGFNIDLWKVTSNADGQGIPIYLPFASREALDLNNWKLKTISNPDPFKSTPYWGYYYCSSFWDLYHDHPVTVQVEMEHGPISVPGQSVASAMANPSAVWLVQYFGDDCVSCEAPTDRFMDAVLMYRMQTTDPPLEEPSAITLSAAVGSNTAVVTCTAAGTFSRMSPDLTSPAATLIDITQDVHWQVLKPVSGGPPVSSPVATISNVPAIGSQLSQIGVLTWHAMPTGSDATSTYVIASRGAMTSKPLTPPLPATAPAASATVAVNLYPRQTLGTPNHNGAVPWTSQVYVQRLFADASTIDDDTANTTVSPATLNYKLTASPVAYLEFDNTDPTSGSPNGSFMVPAPGDSIPTGQQVITVTAQDTTGSGKKDSMAVTVQVTESAVLTT